MRTKFKVDTKTLTVSGATLHMTPVVSDSKENEKFYKYTPSGNLVLSIINLEVANQFNPGDEVYIDFTVVTKEKV